MRGSRQIGNALFGTHLRVTNGTHSRGLIPHRLPLQSIAVKVLRDTHKSDDEHSDRSPRESGLDLDACFREFAPRIRKMVLRYSGDADLAEEVVQETFLRAHRFRHLFDPSRPVWPWLSKIAARLCANEIGRRKRSPVDVGLALADRRPATDPEEQHLARNGEALAALSARHRRALVLKYLFGYRYEHIAQLEGISVHGVDSLLLRARRALRAASTLPRADGRSPCSHPPVPRRHRRRRRPEARTARRLRAPPLSIGLAR